MAPEFTKAVAFLDSFLVHRTIPGDSTDIPTTKITKDICNTNNIQLTTLNTHSRDIPGGYNWRWHQSKGRKSVHLPESDISGTLHKLIPRKLNRVENLNQIPKFKLWHLNYELNSTHVHLLWCEKGYSTTELRIDDFLFLAPFLSEDFIQQFWPQYNSTQ